MFQIRGKKRFMAKWLHRERECCSGLAPYTATYTSQEGGVTQVLPSPSHANIFTPIFLIFYCNLALGWLYFFGAYCIQTIEPCTVWQTYTSNPIHAMAIISVRVDFIIISWIPCQVKCLQENSIILTWVVITLGIAISKVYNPNLGEVATIILR
jgi:hypothetical protein